MAKQVILGTDTIKAAFEKCNANYTELFTALLNVFVESMRTILTVAVEPLVLLIQGDSTGNGENEWPYLTSQALGTNYPAYTIDYRLWNDTNQSYDLPVRIQTGTDGDGYATFDGVAGSYFSSPDKASLDITGDIEIIAKVASDDYSLTQTIVSKFGGGGQRGYSFYIATGKLWLWWSTDGTANTVKPSTVTLPITNGNAIWVKVTFDVDNGAAGNTINFYTSLDGITWTALGTPVVTAGVTSIYANTYQLEIGSRSGGGSEMFKGKIHKVIIKNDINGKAVLSPDFGLARGTTFKDAEGNVFTINGGCTVGNGAPVLLMLNGSTAGKKLEYSADITRLALQTPIKPHLAFINYGHNEGDNVEYTAPYLSFCNQLLAAYPDVGIVCTAQNPQQAPEINIVPHATRCQQIIALARINRYGLINAYDSFIGLGDFSSYMTDGCHPNANGQALWLTLVKTFLRLT